MHLQTHIFINRTHTMHEVGRGPWVSSCPVPLLKPILTPHYSCECYFIWVLCSISRSTEEHQEFVSTTLQFNEASSPILLTWEERIWKGSM